MHRALHAPARTPSIATAALAVALLAAAAPPPAPPAKPAEAATPAGAKPAPSAAQACFDRLATLAGEWDADTLVNRWTTYANGKADGVMVFSVKRRAAEAPKQPAKPAAAAG